MQSFFFLLVFPPTYGIDNVQNFVPLDPSLQLLSPLTYHTHTSKGEHGQRSLGILYRIEIDPPCGGCSIEDCIKDCVKDYVHLDGYNIAKLPPSLCENDPVFEGRKKKIMN